MIIIQGQEPTPQYLWVSSSVVRKIRATSMLTGAVSAAVSLVVGVLMWWGGGALPNARSPFNWMMIAIELCSVFFLLLIAFSLLWATSYATGEYLDIAGTRVALRVLLVLGIATVGTAALACFVLVMTPTHAGGSTARPDVHGGLPVPVYLLLPFAACAIAVIDCLIARYLLRPSPALLPRNDPAWPPNAGLPGGR
ncbi:hypothetical protein F0L68_17060 [Solihabitans fulvus]|uniref:Uncharacterized protein n=1 Tax=Solihabitans fulvus TaxID=1892852 RepID=A0A5B2XCV0_9PSEU|nr:hypothetical protein [Solihabitans fulvus]KAA2261487.1 hypothetical protein F0L68_17060 [Solihabitans fulvus]